MEGLTAERPQAIHQTINRLTTTTNPPSSNQAFYLQPTDKGKGKGGKDGPSPPESGNERKVLPPRQDSFMKLKEAAEKAASKSVAWWRGENAPFAIMMVLTSVYMITELAMSLVTGCVGAFVG